MSSHRTSAGADKPAMAPLLLCPYFLPSVPFSRGWGAISHLTDPTAKRGHTLPQRPPAPWGKPPSWASRGREPRLPSGGSGAVRTAALRPRRCGRRRAGPVAGAPFSVPCRAVPGGRDRWGQLGQEPGRQEAGAARRGAGPAAAGRGGRRSQPSCVRCRGWGGCWRRGGGGGRRAAASAPWPATARSSGGGPTLPITASTLVSSSPRGPVTSPTLPSPPRDGARRGEAAAACRSY